MPRLDKVVDLVRHEVRGNAFGYAFGNSFSSTIRFASSDSYASSVSEADPRFSTP